MLVHSAHSLVDGLIIIIQENKQVGFTHAGIVHSLIGQSARKGAIADEGHALRTISQDAGSLGISECGTDGCG